MSVVLGSPVPQRLGVPAAGASFPHPPGTYTSPEGAVIVPPGALDRWWAWRATGGGTPKDMVVFGDSTTFGAGGEYSWLQRVRDRAIGYGLPDGGKGIVAGLEAEILYDAPEVNAIVTNNWTGTTDSFDNLCGSYLFDDGAVAGRTLTMQFRSTAVRIWYAVRGARGAFTYAIDGGAPVTIDAHSGTELTCKFTYVSGLAANTTHTIVFTNLASAGNPGVGIALAPVNATGLRIQKHAISGLTFALYFNAGLADPLAPADGLRFQTALGLNHSTIQASDGYAGMTVDTSYALGARVDPILAIADLGFNDLGNSVDSTDLPAWTAYVRKFAAGCRARGCDGMIVSGQLPYNAKWTAFGIDRYNLVKSEALAQGLAFVDHFYPIGGPSLSYAGASTNPHLTKAQYITQGDFLWDNVLALA